nr:MAG TPA: hypothetical protein [Caudoviricetes sp.]
MTNELQFGLDKIVKLWYHVLVNEGKEKSPEQNQKIFSKSFQNPLTNKQIYGIIKLPKNKEEH